MNNTLVQWLEDFRSRFGEYEEAQPTIVQVETALQFYSKVVGGSQLTHAVAKAVEDHSLLPNGLEWHLQRFLNALLQQQGSDKDNNNTAEQVKNLTQTYHLLVQWLEDFRANFEFVAEAVPTIQKVENTIKLFNNIVGKQPTRLAPAADKKGSTLDGNSTNNNNNNSSTSKISRAVEPKYVYVYPVSEPTDVKTAAVNNSNDNNNNAQGKTPLQAAPLTRAEQPPEHLAFGAALVKEVVRKEENLKESLGKHILLAINWDFVSHPNFASNVSIITILVSTYYSQQ